MDERNYFQLERDQVHTLGQITAKKLEEVLAEEKNLEKGLEEDEEHHQVEIKVSLVCKMMVEIEMLGIFSQVLNATMKLKIFIQILGMWAWNIARLMKHLLCFIGILNFIRCTNRRWSISCVNIKARSRSWRRRLWSPKRSSRKSWISWS